jgi:hypothetical protein
MVDVLPLLAVALLDDDVELAALEHGAALHEAALCPTPPSANQAASGLVLLKRCARLRRGRG